MDTVSINVVKRQRLTADLVYLTLVPSMCTEESYKMAEAICSSFVHRFTDRLRERPYINIWTRTAMYDRAEYRSHEVEIPDLYELLGEFENTNADVEVFIHNTRTSRFIPVLEVVKKLHSILDKRFLSLVGLNIYESFSGDTGTVSDIRVKEIDNYLVSVDAPHIPIQYAANTHPLENVSSYTMMIQQLIRDGRLSVSSHDDERMVIGYMMSLINNDDV